MPRLHHDVALNETTPITRLAKNLGSYIYVSNSFEVDLNDTQNDFLNP